MTDTPPLSALVGIGLPRTPHPDPLVEAGIATIDAPENGYQLTRGWISEEDVEVIAAAVVGALADQLPYGTDRTVAWLRSRGLGTGCGPGAVLATIRHELLSYADREGDQP